MPAPEKRSDVVEVHWERAIRWGVLGVVCILGGLFFLRYGRDWAGIDLTSLSWVPIVAGPVMVIYAISEGINSRKVPSYTTMCSYCGHEMVFTAAPEEDFVCDGCGRRVPVKDGQVLSVTAVRCGYCQALNYMSEKTLVLICEECDREIPLLDPETGETRHVPRGFARVDDESLYELVLVNMGREKEAVMKSLQTMLAINHAQALKLVEELPVSLLSGINRRKAEMLRAQLEANGAVAELKQITPA